MAAFKVFKIVSPSLESPNLSRPSVKSLCKSCSHSSKTSLSLAAIMISGLVHTRFTIVTKYLANLKGISYKSFSKTSTNTCVSAEQSSFAHLTTAF